MAGGNDRVRIGAILAGGKSRRMGVDKAILKLRGVRLVDHVHEQLCRQVDRVIISGSCDYGLGLSVITDDTNGIDGPVAGILALSKWMKDAYPKTRGFVTAPVDGPFLPNDLAGRLMGGASSAVAFVDTTVHPTFAFWVWQDIEGVRDQFSRGSQGSLKRLAELVGATPVQWENGADFANINTLNDLEALK